VKAIAPNFPICSGFDHCKGTPVTAVSVAEDNVFEAEGTPTILAQDATYAKNAEQVYEIPESVKVFITFAMHFTDAALESKHIIKQAFSGLFGVISQELVTDV
jgi:hypothetical protein